MEIQQISIATALCSAPSRVMREEVAQVLAEIAHRLGLEVGIPEIDSDYLPLETGDKRLKNALGVLKSGIVFYTKDESLLRLLEEHGLNVSQSPFANEASVHNKFRWRIPHVTAQTIEEFRPLFVSMVHDSIAYIRS